MGRSSAPPSSSAPSSRSSSPPPGLFAATSEGDVAHPPNLRRSLARNDAELAALTKLHKALRAIRDEIVEKFGEGALVEAVAKGSDPPARGGGSVWKLAEDGADEGKEEEEDGEREASEDGGGGRRDGARLDRLLLAFSLRMRLRRRLLNRLARRLRRVAHALDGPLPGSGGRGSGRGSGAAGGGGGGGGGGSNDAAAPPSPPQYGDVIWRYVAKETERRGTSWHLSLGVPKETVRLAREEEVKEFEAKRGEEGLAREELEAKRRARREREGEARGRKEGEDEGNDEEDNDGNDMAVDEVEPTGEKKGVAGSEGGEGATDGDGEKEEDAKGDADSERGESEGTNEDGEEDSAAGSADADDDKSSGEAPSDDADVDVVDATSAAAAAGTAVDVDLLLKCDEEDAPLLERLVEHEPGYDREYALGPTPSLPPPSVGADAGPPAEKGDAASAGEAEADEAAKEASDEVSKRVVRTRAPVASTSDDHEVDAHGEFASGPTDDDGDRIQMNRLLFSTRARAARVLAPHERAAEWKRWTREMRERIPERATFDQAGVPGGLGFVFDLEERRKRKRADPTPVSEEDDSEKKVATVAIAVGGKGKVLRKSSVVKDEEKEEDEEEEVDDEEESEKDEEEEDGEEQEKEEEASSSASDASDDEEESKDDEEESKTNDDDDEDGEEDAEMKDSESVPQKQEGTDAPAKEGEPDGDVADKKADKAAAPKDPPKKKPARDFPLAPVPSFYYQDLKRVRLLQNELVDSRKVQKSREKAMKIKARYDEAYQFSMDIQNRLAAAKHDLTSTHKKHAVEKANLERYGKQQVREARVHWSQRQHERNQIIKVLGPEAAQARFTCRDVLVGLEERVIIRTAEKVQGEGLGTNRLHSLAQKAKEDGDEGRAISATVLGHVVDAVDRRVRDDLANCRTFVPPQFPHAEIVMYGLKPGETLERHQARQINEQKRNVAALKTAFQEAEKTRADAWGAWAEARGGGQPAASSRSRGRRSGGGGSRASAPAPAAARRSYPVQMQQQQRQAASAQPGPGHVTASYYRQAPSASRPRIATDPATVAAIEKSQRKAIAAAAAGYAPGRVDARAAEIANNLQNLVARNLAGRGHRQPMVARVPMGAGGVPFHPVQRAAMPAAAAPVVLLGNYGAVTGRSSGHEPPAAFHPVVEDGPQQPQPSAVPASATESSQKTSSLAKYGYGDRYSATNVKARKNPDGTVVPASAPKLLPDGRFARPAGRQRKGMDWDAIRGCWFPLPDGQGQQGGSGGNVNN